MPQAIAGLTPEDLLTLKNIVDIRFKSEIESRARATGNWAEQVTTKGRSVDGVGWNLELGYDPSSINPRPLNSQARFDEIDITQWTVAFKDFDHGIKQRITDFGTLTDALLSKASNGAAKYATVLHEEICNFLNVGDTAAVPMPTGFNFFDTNIPVDPLGTITFTNLFNGVLDDVNLAAGQAAMSRFPMDDGKVSNLVANWLITPSELTSDAWRFTNTQYLYSNAGGRELGATLSEVLSTISTGWSSFLTDTDDWFLLYADGMTRPFYWVTHAKNGSPAYTMNSDHDIQKQKFIEMYSFMQASGWPFDSRYAAKFVAP